MCVAHGTHYGTREALWRGGRGVGIGTMGGRSQRWMGRKEKNRAGERGRKEGMRAGKGRKGFDETVW